MRIVNKNQALTITVQKYVSSSADNHLLAQKLKWDS